MTALALAPIPYHEPTAAIVRELIAKADALENDLDTEAYSSDPLKGRRAPEVRAAHAVRARPFMAFQSAGFAILRTVCGSDKHPLCREWLNYVHSPVVDAVRRGAGILEGFLLSWKGTALWPTTGSDDTAEVGEIAATASDFGLTGGVGLATGADRGPGAAE